jgi:hypothetical protein
MKECAFDKTELEVLYVYMCMCIPGDQTSPPSTALLAGKKNQAKIEAMLVLGGS